MGNGIHTHVVHPRVDPCSAVNLKMHSVLEIEHRGYNDREQHSEVDRPYITRVGLLDSGSDEVLKLLVRLLFVRSVTGLRIGSGLIGEKT